MNDSHEGPVPPGGGAMLFRQHAVHDVLVNVDPERVRDNARNPWTAELSPRTLCTLPRKLSSRRTLPIVLKKLNGVRERTMIMSMATTARPQQRYDHRLRNRPTQAGEQQRALPARSDPTRLDFDRNVALRRALAQHRRQMPMINGRIGFLRITARRMFDRLSVIISGWLIDSSAFRQLPSLLPRSRAHN
jgi:hypothetical protein